MRDTVAPLIGSLIFFIIAPGTVAGIVPYAITRWRMRPAFFEIEWVPAAGAAILVVGVAMLVDCVLRFALQGRGTPAPVAPTRHLVVSGLYRYVRNPMYVAVLSIVAGQALLFGSAALLAYAAMVWLAFQLFVVFYEEPTLRRTFGASYETYCTNVARWTPRLRPWPGGAPGGLN